MSYKQPIVDASDSTVTQLIRRIAVHEDVPDSELPILNDTIDPDALETIVTKSSPPVTVAFEYAGYKVVIKATDEDTSSVSIEPT